MAITKNSGRQELIAAYVDINLADVTTGVDVSALDLPVNAVIVSGSLTTTGSVTASRASASWARLTTRCHRRTAASASVAFTRASIWQACGELGRRAQAVVAADVLAHRKPTLAEAESGVFDKRAATR